MKCPACGHEFKNPVCVSGGSVKVAKGFASPSVQAKAQASLKKNREIRKG